MNPQSPHIRLFYESRAKLDASSLKIFTNLVKNILVFITVKCSIFV